MAAKPVGPDFSILQNLADHAHKLVNEFVAVPLNEQQRAGELVIELEHVIAEFRRLRPAPVFKGARQLWLAETKKPRLCSICEQGVDLKNRDYFETEGAIYHRACYNSVVGD
jgi:hypothetical protein